MTMIEDQARSLFIAALEHAPDQWSAFLKQACGDNSELLARVDQLLRAHQVMGSIHGGGTDAPRTTPNGPPITEGPGTDVGPYKLVEQIGEGGMGIVFLAQQERPVRRRVAVKIIKPGMDTRQVIVRFEAERQAMALMEHANIAKVLDAGATKSGRPYFVMELVHGVPITDYCDECNLTTRERLELFVELCQAVQHAHQKGVIHRDIKPTNVLVAIEDGRPAPKIIDFGIVKAINQRLTEQTLVTSFTQMVGTPLYMSPEQSELSPLGVDTRSDVYSLGVLLYELLTGTTPFDKDRLHTAPYDEVRRILREEEPPRPSSRISTLSADLATTVASQRRTDPGRLLHTVRGELDWIVMKALEKDRNRRYESVNNFATDVERFLKYEAVEACPPSAAYWLQKFVRRHRGSVAAAAALLLMLCLGLAGTSVGLYRARVAENKANLEASNALESEQRATDEASNFRRLNFRMAFDRGLALCEQGRVGRGMLWLNRALELAPAEDTDMRRVILANLNAWQCELHSLEAIFPHEQMVVAAAFSPDGKLILTGSADGTALLWNRTGHRIVKLEHGGEVHEVAFSPDGSRLLTASFDHSARLWDTQGKLLNQFRHNGLVLGAAFTPDGSWIVTGGADREVNVWDAGSGDRIGGLSKHDHVIHDVAVSSIGTTVKVATACFDKRARVWDIQDLNEPQCVAEFVHDSHVDSVDFRTTDGGIQLLSGTKDGNVYLWDVAETEQIERPWRHRGMVHRLRVSPDGSQVLTASMDNSAQLWNADTGAGVGVPFEHQSAVQGVAFSPDGALIVTACDDNAARLWRPAAGHSLRIVTHKGLERQEAVYTSDGRCILIKGENEKSSVRDALTGELIGVPFPTGEVLAVAVSPDGSMIVTGSGTAAQLWDATTGEPLFSPFQSGGVVHDLDFSSDGTRMLTAAADGTVQLWDVRMGEPIDEPLKLAPVYGATFSPDGSRIAVASADKLVRVFDEKMGNIPRPLHGHQSIVVGVAFSSDGQRIVTGSTDNTARVWDAEAGKALSAPMRHRGPLWNAVAFSPDGRTVVTGSDDRTVRIWDVDTARPIGPALTHNSAVLAVAFRGDTQILTGSAIGNVRLWNASIEPLKDDVERITVWLQVMTGMELDDEGTLNVLDAQTWQQRRSRFNQLGGAPTAETAAEYE